MKLQALPGKFKGHGLVRDKHGNPKVDRHQLDKWWPHISAEDRAHLLTVYPDYQPKEG